MFISLSHHPLLFPPPHPHPHPYPSFSNLHRFYPSSVTRHTCPHLSSSSHFSAQPPPPQTTKRRGQHTQPQNVTPHINQRLNSTTADSIIINFHIPTTLQTQTNLLPEDPNHRVMQTVLSKLARHRRNFVQGQQV